MGLLKTAGTVAVASAVHGRIQRRQQQRWAAQDLAAAQAAMPEGAVAPVPAQGTPGPAAPQSAVSEQLDQLTRLGDLRQAGVLTEAEFQAQKDRILNG